MTTTPQPPPPPPPPPPLPAAPSDPVLDPTSDTGPRVGLDDVRDLGRLRRTVGPERSVAGVAGGLGRHLDVDPVLFKVAFVVLAFFGGVGLLLYAACWLLVPAEDATTAPLGLDDRTRSTVLVVLGAVAAVVLLGTTLGVDVVPLPLVVLALIGLVVVLQVDKRRRRRGTASPAPHPPDARPDHSAYPAHPAHAPLPRRPGPILFWFTLALAALGVGVLLTVDLAGVGVPAAAYPALVLALSGAMLLLGAFWGRAGGLVLLGLLALVTLAGTAVADAYDGVQLRETPTSSAEVLPSYTFESGELLLDLREVTDVAALDGRTLTLAGEVGSIEVVVPPGVGVSARAEIEGPGVASVLGVESGGLTTTNAVDSDPAAPVQLRIEAGLDAGAIVIHTDPERTDR